MINRHNIVHTLTSQAVSQEELVWSLGTFASELGWEPSDSLDVPGVRDVANAHLIIEHGLENAAVITFMKYPFRYSQLGYEGQNRLLSIPYNNLIDWQINVERDGVSFVYGRTDPPSLVERYTFGTQNIDQLRSESFQHVAQKRPNPDLPALDDALIDTISFWRRNLSAELNHTVNNEELSALFNTLILTRAVEDYAFQNNLSDGGITKVRSSQRLLGALQKTGEQIPSLRSILLATLNNLTGRKVPNILLNQRHLKVFDALDPATIRALFRDFYYNRSAPYLYDFSLISKHALSRVYEHYVSLLRVEEAPRQLSLLPTLPQEELNKAYGSVYTPQYIARFFARYLRENTPRSTKAISAADPACGSGIFLRTLLELEYDPVDAPSGYPSIREAFDNVLGIDFDENAAYTARLSLALLHLSLKGRFPTTLNVISAEAIDYYLDNPQIAASYDAVIANPPFVALGTQNPELRARLAQFMQGYAVGRIDLYLAFLRMGLEMLKPGGFGLFVLPHSFLLADNARRMRNLLAESAWVHCLADLSAIRVFGNVGAYVILLIFQKKDDQLQIAPRATIVKCQDSVGRALQDALRGRLHETNVYSVYNVEQSTFAEDQWFILPPVEASIQRKMDALPKVSDFLHVRQGFLSGANEVFVIDADQVPDDEKDLFVPFLPDRQMRAYTVPNDTGRYVFYPYIDGKKLNEEKLREYPRTWQYLESHKAQLSARKAVINGSLPWWQPERPRKPEHLLRPKIISPHLVVVPRFSVDLEGRYAISRAPLFQPKGTGTADEDILQYFVAVLNSTACYWYIRANSHKYKSGYSMLELKTLKATPVPDPSQVPSGTMIRLLRLVDRRLQASGSEASEIETDIDSIVADLYGLSAHERDAIGM